MCAVASQTPPENTRRSMAPRSVSSASSISACHTSRGARGTSSSMRDALMDVLEGQTDARTLNGSGMQPFSHATSDFSVEYFCSAQRRKREHPAPLSSVLGKGFCCRHRVESLTEQLDLAVFGEQHAGVCLPIRLAGIDDQSFDLVFRGHLVGSLDEVGQILEAKIGDLGEQVREQFFYCSGTLAMSLYPGQFEHAVLGKLRRGYLGRSDVVQIGFKQFGCGFHLSFLHRVTRGARRSRSQAMHRPPFHVNGEVATPRARSLPCTPRVR